MQPYSGLEVPLDQRDASSMLHFVTGTLPASALEQLSIAGNVTLLPLPAPEKGRRSLIALTTRAGEAALHERLRQAGFQPGPLPVRAGATTQSLCTETLREEASSKTQLDVLNHEREALAAAASTPLTAIESSARIERRLCEAEQSCHETAASVLVTGWIAAPDFAAVRDELASCAKGLCVIEAAEPHDISEAEIPVLLRPASWLRPFQILVTAYGFPNYRELVPTLFVTISYVLMFGMMFGDVGHGGLLALAGAGILLVSHQTRARDTGVLLLVNGLSSAIFGAAYGSYFGLPFLKEHALWHDPLEGDPLALMFFAMALGVGVMSLGLGLNICNRLRHGEVAEAFLGKFGVAGVIFYWGALVLAAQAAAIQAQGWWNVAVGGSLGGPVACWIMNEPLAIHRRRRRGQGGESDGMFAALAEALVGAFEGVLLYVANTISFVRLAAYAMSHAALLMAAFALADQVRSLTTGGTALGLAVIVLGNAAAMVLEGIVAAVQALRLDMYEFFGKFFAGDGQPFKPFSLVAQGRDQAE